MPVLKPGVKLKSGVTLKQEENTVPLQQKVDEAIKAKKTRMAAAAQAA